MRWRLIAVLTVLAALIGTGAGLAIQLRPAPAPPISAPVQPKEPVAGEAIPLEPIGLQLTMADAQQAEQIVRKDAQIQQRLSTSRFRFVGVYPLGEGLLPPEIRAPAKEATAGDVCQVRRCATVLIYDYTVDIALHVAVDLQTGTVIRVDERHGQPLLSPDESQRAHELAEADPPVQAMLGGQAHRHPGKEKAMSGSRDSGPCAIHRCAFVFFLLEDGRTLGVLVDLSTEQVVDRFFARGGTR